MKLYRTISYVLVLNSSADVRLNLVLQESASSLLKVKVYVEVGVSICLFHTI